MCLCLLLKAGRLPEGVRTKKVENSWKKVVQPAFGCAQHPKAGRNMQHASSPLCDLLDHFNYELLVCFQVVGYITN